MSTEPVSPVNTEPGALPVRIPTWRIWLVTVLACLWLLVAYAFYTSKGDPLLAAVFLMPALGNLYMLWNFTRINRAADRQAGEPQP